MFEAIAIGVATKIVQWVIKYLVEMGIDLYEVSKDEERRKQAVKKAEEGDNSDLEDMLNSHP